MVTNQCDRKGCDIAEKYLDADFLYYYRFRFFAERVVVEVEGSRPEGRPLPFLTPFGLPR